MTPETGRCDRAPRPSAAFAFCNVMKREETRSAVSNEGGGGGMGWEFVRARKREGTGQVTERKERRGADSYHN